MMFDMKDTEQQLIELQPQPLGDALFLRLEQAMTKAHDESSVEQEMDLAELEGILGELSPSGFGEDFLVRLDSAMQDWQEEGEKEAKIVPFHQEEGSLHKTVASEGQSNNTFWRFASIAAVALFGGVAALMMTQPSAAPTSSLAQLPSKTFSQPSLSSASLQNKVNSTVNVASNSPQIKLTESMANRNIIGVSSEGVRNNQNNQPCRCLRVEYIDVVELINSEGKRMKIEEPKVEFLYIPLERN